MGIHTTEAIVLRQYPFRETSVTVTCFSDRFGKFKGLVKGLRAQPSRHRSHMEPLTVNRLVFYDTLTSHLHLISQCELLQPLSGLQRDVETFRLAAWCSELVEAVMPLEEPHPGAYGLLKNALVRLEQGWTDAPSLEAHFLVRVLRVAGFQPQVDECTGCGRRVRSRAHWSARQGGLLCEACLHHDPRAAEIPPAVLDTLEQLAEAELPPTLEPALAHALRGRLDDFVRWRLDRPLKTVGQS